MTEQRARLDTVGDRPAVRLERRLAHSPEKVWAAITEPAELAHWFPAAVDTELTIGARMRFTFADNDIPVSSGEILEFDPTRVFAFSWNDDVLRFDLFPDGAGSRLVFTHSFGRGEPEIAKLAAGRNAAGWDACLGALLSRLERRTFEPPTEWLGPMEAYIEEFGLGAGEILDQPGGYLVRFRRDLLWKTIDEVWALLVEGEEPSLGSPPPARLTNGYLEPGPVTALEAPRVLEYEWLRDGTPAGLVRTEITHDPFEGTRMELTQTLPAELADFRATALAAWHTQLELFFAALHGDVRCPWPTERTEALEKRYAATL